MRPLVCCLIVLASCTSEQRRPAAETVPDSAAVVARPPPDAGVPAPPQEPPPGRALTAGEIAMARPFFGDAIDYTRVRVVADRYFALHPAGVYMTPNGNIYAPGSLYEPDFSSTEVYLPRRAIFIHEMTHVWQHQSGINLIVGGVIEFLRQGGDYGRAYPYRLVAGRDLLDYGIEQQASIVEDQARIRLGLAPASLVERGLRPGERDVLYAAVLSRLLANPGYARLLPPEELHARVGRADTSGLP